VSAGWDALIEDNYKCIMPLTWKKKYGFYYLPQPPFTQQLGVFSVDKLSALKVNEFLQSIPSKYKLIEINLNKYNTADATEFEVSNKITHELDLIDSIDNLRKNYSENTLRNISKAKKAALSIDYKMDPDEVITMFKKNRGTAFKQIGKGDYLMLKRIMNRCLANKSGICWGVRTAEQKLCAGAFFVQTNNKVVFLFSATDLIAKKSGAMSFLIDHFIEQNAQRNLTFDFEGSNDKNLARFYKSFGSAVCQYKHVRSNRLAFPFSLLKK
jgi:hypothetical protein